jgi:ribulose kinase
MLVDVQSLSVLHAAGLPVRLSEVADSVLLGSAVGAAAAAGLYPDMQVRPNC